MTVRLCLLCTFITFTVWAQNEAEEDKKYLKWRVTEEAESCDMFSQEGDKIEWDYEGTLEDGTVFDKGRFQAVLGAGDVIKGVDRAMRDMCPGERRRMRIEAEWAYGERGFTDLIPPNAAIVFDVRLRRITRGSKTAATKDEL